MKASSACAILISITLLAPLRSQAAAGVTRVTLQDSQFLQAPSEPVQANEIQLKAEYDRRFRMSRSWWFVFHPYLQASNLPGTREQQTTLDPRDVYIEFERRGNYLRAGAFTLKWEGTDGLNPMDLGSMKNWSDPLSPMTRASLGLALGRSGESYEVEAGYIPQQTKSQLPGEKSAWLPRKLNLPLQSSSTEARLPSRVEYQYLPRKEIDQALTNNYFARAQLHLTDVDVSAAYFEGAADMPTLVPILSGTLIQLPPNEVVQLNNPVQIQPTDYRRRSVAGLITTTLGSWIVRAAARYDQPIGESNSKPTWSQKSVAGVERSFEIAGDTITLLAQLAWTKHPESKGLLSVEDIFNQALLLGARYPIGESWTLFVSGFRSGADGSSYAKGEVGYRISENYRIDAAYEDLQGPPLSLLGVYGDNDRATLALTGTF